MRPPGADTEYQTIIFHPNPYTFILHHLKGEINENSKKQLISLLLGAIIGYLLYYHFFMDVILLIAHEGFLYMIINIAMLLLSIVGCAAIIYLLLEKRVSR